MYRQQFHRGDTQVAKVRDRRRMGQAGVGAAQFRGMSGWRIVRPRTWVS